MFTKPGNPGLAGKNNTVRCALLLLLNQQDTEDRVSGLTANLPYPSENLSQGTEKNVRFMLSLHEMYI